MVLPRVITVSGDLRVIKWRAEVPFTPLSTLAGSFWDRLATGHQLQGASFQLTTQTRRKVCFAVLRCLFRASYQISEIVKRLSSSTRKIRFDLILFFPKSDYGPCWFQFWLSEAKQKAQSLVFNLKLLYFLIKILLKKQILFTRVIFAEEKWFQST